MSDLNVEPVTSFPVRRLTVPIPGVKTFQTRYEEAVPNLPLDRVKELVASGAPWSAMVDLMQAAAPHSFFIYFRNDVHPVMANAGHSNDCVAYLMGKHVIAETMFRHDPGPCSTPPCGPSSGRIPPAEPGSQWTSPAPSSPALGYPKWPRSAKTSTGSWHRSSKHSTSQYPPHWSPRQRPTHTRSKTPPPSTGQTRHGELHPEASGAEEKGTPVYRPASTTPATHGRSSPLRPPPSSTPTTGPSPSKGSSPTRPPGLGKRSTPCPNQPTTATSTASPPGPTSAWPSAVSPSTAPDGRPPTVDATTKLQSLPRGQVPTSETVAPISDSLRTVVATISKIQDTRPCTPWGNMNGGFDATLGDSSLEGPRIPDQSPNFGDHQSRRSATADLVGEEVRPAQDGLR